MQAQSSYGKIIGVMIHVLVWAVFGLAIFYYQPVLSNFEIPYQFWIKQTLELSLLVITFYLNAFVLVPRLLLRNYRVYYFVIIIGIVIAILFMNRSLDRAYTNSQERILRQAAEQLGHPGPPRFIPGRRGIPGITLTVTITALVVGISTAMTAIQKSQRDNQERKELEKDKVTTELSFLKAQINPHFFFNTLNNIYVLTAEDPKVAGEAIHQLSKMMRYLLYDTQQGKNMLSQEIAFVKNYISLMKLRLTDVVKITLDTPASVQDMPLAPMILLPFVENAFKHGVSATQASYIDIIIFQRDKVLDLKVLNSIRKDNSVSLDTDSGIGLINTRRRLDLLYPGKYKLDISKTKAATEYSVHLVLDLS
ncbi:MAG TPA: histidine kinase [Chitinophagaceae bacterium]|nr:histidine kinase [Chitinophagaceae bacterium]